MGEGLWDEDSLGLDLKLVAELFRGLLVLDVALIDFLERVSFGFERVLFCLERVSFGLEVGFDGADSFFSKRVMNLRHF